LIVLAAGVGKSSLLLRFSDDSFDFHNIPTIGIDIKLRTVDIDGRRVRLQLYDTAGQERFRTITTLHYRRAMGIIFVYDVTNEASFRNIEEWVRNVEKHAAPNVNKILIGAS